MVQVQLLRAHPSLGDAGSRHIITPGYARNKLIPSGFAALVDPVTGQVFQQARESLTAAARRRSQADTARLAALASARREQLAQLERKREDERLAREEALKGEIANAKAQLAVWAAASAQGAVKIGRRARADQAGEQKPLFGSVTLADVREAIRAAAPASSTKHAPLAIETLEFVAGESQGAIENDRAKSTGSYTGAPPPWMWFAGADISLLSFDDAQRRRQAQGQRPSHSARLGTRRLHFARVQCSDAVPSSTAEEAVEYR